MLHRYINGSSFPSIWRNATALCLLPLIFSVKSEEKAHVHALIKSSEHYGAIATLFMHIHEPCFALLCSALYCQGIIITFDRIVQWPQDPSLVNFSYSGHQRSSVLAEEEVIFLFYLRLGPIGYKRIAESEERFFCPVSTISKRSRSIQNFLLSRKFR